MVKTLTDCLDKAALREGGYVRAAMTKDAIEEISYKELREKALKVAEKLTELGQKKGDKIIFQIKDIKNYLFIFWGCLYAGIQPVPLTLPMIQNANNEACVKVKNVFNILGGAMVFADSDNKDFYNELFAGEQGLVADVGKFLQDIDDYPEYTGCDAKPEDVAFIQFSSGSTGQSKGVVLTHKNLVTNASQIVEGINADENAKVASWMPLTHDMGLIGFHLSSVYVRASHTIFDPQVFIRYPLFFMEYLSKEKILFTGFPNFGIEWILKFVKKKQLEGLDFSNLKYILNGAEPINCQSSAALIELLKDNGLDDRSICFSYGMAEACVGVSLAGRKPIREIVIDGYDYSHNNKITECERSDNSLSLAVIAPPLKGIDMRIADEEGRPLAKGEIGEICIKGDNVMGGYFNYDNSTVFTEDGYFKTGDIGFFYGDSIVISGRKKDIIFKNGANYYAHDIERVVADICPDLRGGTVVIQPNYQKKKNPVVLLIKGSFSEEKLADMKKTINEEMLKRTGIVFDDVSAIKTIAKTTSGKIQRYKLQYEYEEKKAM